MGQVTGSAQLPPGVLDNILANVDATADYTIKRRGLAGQALGYDPSNPINYPDYPAAGQRPANHIRPTPTSCGRTTARSVRTPPASDSTPAQTARRRPFEAYLGRVSHVFGGGSQAAAACSRAAPAGGFIGPAGDEKRPAWVPALKGSEMPQHVVLSNGYKLDIPDGMTNEQISDRVNHMEALDQPAMEGLVGPVPVVHGRVARTSPTRRDGSPPPGSI